MAGIYNSGVGDSAAKRIVAFYIVLLEANTSFESISSTPKPKVVKNPKDSVKKIPEPQKERTSIEEKHEAKEEIPQKNQKFPDLNINIQIHISSDATSEQIEKIFEAMAKHLYKN